MSSIATIKPGDRIYITERHALSVGDIMTVADIVTDGDYVDYVAGGSWIHPSHCLRVLAPGDVIPKGAVTRKVRADGVMGDDITNLASAVVATHSFICEVLVSIPEPEPSPEPSVKQLAEDIIDDMAAFTVLLRKRIEEAS